MKFKVGKYYRYVGKYGRRYWSKEMREVLDSRPRKCTYYMPVKDGVLGDCFEANFEGVPIPISYIGQIPISYTGQIGWRWGENDIFEEVQMEPIVGKKYWVDDCSEWGVSRK